MLTEALEDAGKIVGRAVRDVQAVADVDEISTVDSITGCTAEVSGLKSVKMEELLTFPDGVSGMAFTLSPDSVGVVFLDEPKGVKAGDRVLRTHRVVDVPVGEALLGRVINPLGKPLDGKGAVETVGRLPIEREAFPIMARAPVSVPLQTGIKAIDSFTPVGRGQRELILGDRQTGKTALAVDTIINQKNTGVISIYCSIAQRGTAIARVVDSLTKYGVLQNTVVVAASADETAGMQYIAPYAATAVGEYFMQNGKDVLIIYDDLSKHAVAYRALSLLIRRPPGREAYPGDVFYLHSRLLERAARLAPEYGGGSLTALPIIETQAGDVSAYIPTNVISITDGQIFLETELFHSGVRPAVNPGISVSRVGGNAQIKAMKKVAGPLKLLYSQYRELQSFAQFGSDLDADTKARLAQGERIVAVLKQDKNAPVAVELQVCILYAVTNNLLADVKVEDIRRFEQALFEHLTANEEELLASIRNTGVLSDESAEALKNAVATCKKNLYK